MSQRRLKPKLEGANRGLWAKPAPLREEKVLEVRSNSEMVFHLPSDDNTPDGLKAFQTANAHFRTVRWPAPFDATRHPLRLADAPHCARTPSLPFPLVMT